MQDFPPNSHRARTPEEPKRLERVTTAEPDLRKKGLGRKFKETFVGGDARTAFSYMVVDVVIPAVQDTLIDAFQGGIERLIRGEDARPRRSYTPNGYGNVPRVDYQSISRGPVGARSSTPRMLSRSSKARHSFSELVIPSRQEATEVIDRMFDVLERYGSVTVADLYELTGVQSSHTDMKWGWTELRGAKPARLRQGGFLLDLPEPEDLSR